MKVEGIPASVDPVVVIGNDSNYLVVYTHLTNEIAIEFLEKALEVLRHEQQLDSESSRQVH